MSSSLCNFLTRSQRFLELVKDGRVFQCGNVLRDFLATGDDAQKTAHDFARTGLRQVGAEADFFRTGNRADLARHPFAQVGGDVFRVLAFRQFLLRMTKAQMDSPVRSSGLPTTAASATIG